MLFLPAKVRTLTESSCEPPANIHKQNSGKNETGETNLGGQNLV